MPAKTKPDVEREVVAALSAGVSVGDICSQFGLCDRTVRAIRSRNGGFIHKRVGRPCVTRQELAGHRLDLVHEHMETARLIAWGECRTHSSRPDFDHDEYVSTAYLALVLAAGSWKGRASFKSFLRKCIKLKLAGVRRSEMLSQGWARNTGRGFSNGITHVVQLSSLPGL